MFSHHHDNRYAGPSSPGTEPMALGSPVSSPNRNGAHALNYLPPYLMREAPTHGSPSSPCIGSWSSPTARSAHHSPFVASPPTTRKMLYPNTTPNNSMSSVLNSPTVAKPGGPPARSLFDTITSPQSPDLKYMKLDDSRMKGTPNRMPVSSFQQQERHASGVLTPNKSFNPNSSSYVSPAQIDPFYTQGESLTSNTQLDETWITIFGFPPASVNYVIQQFSHYGKITDRKLETSGNWIHIRYQSKLQAKKALSKNGKIFGDNIMIGVKSCIEMDLMNESVKENTGLEDTATEYSEDSLCIDALNSSRRSLKNIRPLTQIYMSPSASESVPKPKLEPKVNGFVSKAIEYVLKW